MNPLSLFIYLQLLDGLTTYAGIKTGSQELNPIARVFLDHMGLVSGIIAMKAIVAGCGAYLSLRAYPIPSLMNWLFAGIVVFNIAGIISNVL